MSRKPLKPAVKIRVSEKGVMTRRKPAKPRKRPAPKPIIAPVDISIERMERAELRAQEDAQRRAVYLKGNVAKRAASTGATGKRDEKNQAVMYGMLGLDLKAGYDGRPPAFEALEKHKVGKNELLAGIRNCARDPIHILRTMGFMTERHHKAIVAMVDLFEQHEAVGVRGIEYGERVDGGRTPDVSAWALSVASAMSRFQAAISPTDFSLLKAIAIEGMSLRALTRTGVHGIGINTVRKRLNQALDRLALIFEV